MSESFDLIRFLLETGDEAIRFHLGELAYGLIFGGATVAANTYFVHRFIRRGLEDGLIAEIQTTEYMPTVKRDPKTGDFSWVLNPKTGRGFRDQKIRAEDKQVRVRDIFNLEASGEHKAETAFARRIEKYIEKAAAHCDNDNPLVLSYLDKVIPPAEYDQLLNIMSSKWKTYFGSLCRDTQQVLSRPLADNHLRVEGTVLPALIREEGAVGDQFRILLLKVNDHDKIDLPAYEDVQFKMQDGSFRHDADSLQDDRYFALKAIGQYLETDAGRTFVKKFSVAVPTGEIVSLAAPKP